MTMAVSAPRTAKQVAQAVLEKHCIKPQWLRNGEQILGLVEEGIREFREEQKALATLHAVQIHDLAERLDEDSAYMPDEDQASDLSAACEALHHYAEIIEPYDHDD